MSDLISRQAAIDAIKALWNDAPSAQHVSAMFDCEDAIRALPSAEPVRHGKWEPCCEWHGTNGEIETRAYSCSECAIIIPVDIQDVRFSRGCFLRYCPNCGARMDK